MGDVMPKLPEKIYLDDALLILDELRAQLTPTWIEERLAEAAERLRSVIATDEEEV
jgi:hypothetical protein